MQQFEHLKEHNLDSLRALVRALQEENRSLRALLAERQVNTDMESRVDVPQPDEYDPDQGGRILPLTINEDAAKFFFRMFWGRHDVYALRGRKGGYFPKCANRWEAVCPKQHGEKVFCDEDCEYRKWMPLDIKIIMNHLRGTRPDGDDVLGIYPLLPGDMCRFLVFDFDNHEKDSYKTDDANTDDTWKAEVDALRAICKMQGVDVLVERSRSGRGAHIWLFFQREVSASLARNFGFALLDRGAASINLTSFKHYDRMYPSQDTLSKLGNLIALPLQGRALKQGNSAFIDESWNAYPDQWQALKSVRKLSEEEIRQKLMQWTSELSGPSASPETVYANGRVKPWKADSRFFSQDVTGVLHLVLSDGVYVDGLNLMPRLQNAIRCLATIDNPQYLINKRVGRSNYYLFSAISLWENKEGYIRIPRGLLEKAVSLCNDAGIRYDIEDRRVFGRPIRVQFKGQLRPQQEEAMRNMLEHEFGVLDAATASGKTVMSAYMVAQRKVNTLILLESTDLISQWVDSLSEFLEIDEQPPVYYTKTGREKRRDHVIGTLSGGQDRTTGIIDIAMVGSAYKKGEFFPRIGDYGMVIMDECHHAASNQARAILDRVPSKYVYGVSATPVRSDQLDDIIFMMIGPVRHQYSSRKQAEDQNIARLVRPRFTRVVNLSDGDLDIHKADDLIADHEDRTEQIISDVKECVANGRTPLVLTKLKRHAKAINDKLQGFADHVFLIYGDQSAKDNKEVRDAMKQVQRDESMILVATGQKIGEGFDFPRFDTLMLAAPVKFEGRLMQYVGRLTREYEGKRDIVVYDYVDSHIRFFDNQYRNRLKTYKKNGYMIQSDITVGKQQTNIIFDGRDYEETFERDLVEADMEIVVSSPRLRRDKVQKVIDLTKSRMESGVLVTVITMKPERIGYEDTMELQFLTDEMRSAGMTVRLTEDEGEHFAVIDKKIVWHGGMNLLGKPDAWDNLMRVESVQAAAELLEIAKSEIRD